MKISPLVLLIPLLGAAVPTRADEEFMPPTLEERRARLLPHPTGNGFDDLISAYLALDKDTANPAILLGTRPLEQKLEELRVAVENNQPSLDLIRRALNRGVAHPARPGVGVFGGTFGYGSMIRQLWRLLDVEGDFYASEGDTMRAISVYLDGMELSAVAASGGNWLDFLGTSVQSENRKNIAELVPKLSAAQLRATAQRVRAIEARRPPVLSLWRAEKQRGIVELRSFLQEKANTKLNMGDRLKSWRAAEFSSAEARAMLKLSDAQIFDDYNASYDEIVRRTQWPFAKRARTPLPPTNPLVDKYYPSLPHEVERIYYYERATNLLLAGALELRAIKSETGVYPAIFDAAPDPFGANSDFIYRRAGESYVLYSVGPNGANENATPIAKDALTEVLPDGDILAPEL